MDRPFRRGVLDCAPFVLIIVPFGALFGVLATEAGLPVSQVMAFSVVVIAGAAQFTAVQLMAEGAPAAVVIASALAVNLRMVMYSAAMVPHLGSAPLWQRAGLAYMLVDQSFALAQATYEAQPNLPVARKVAYFAGLIALLFPTWVGATWVGAVLGAQVPESWGLDFALPLTFLALVGPMLRSRAHMAAAFVAVVAALLLTWLPWNLGLICAGLLGMATGAEVERRMS